MNKKGIMDDAFDFLFTVVAGLFVMFFIGVVMFGGTAIADEQAVSAIKEVKLKESAINNLRVALNDGVNLEMPGFVDIMIDNSKILSGETISTCNDYKNEVDCKDDTVNVYTNNEDWLCFWVYEYKKCFRIVTSTKANFDKTNKEYKEENG